MKINNNPIERRKMLRLYNTSTETGMNTAKFKNKYRIEEVSRVTFIFQLAIYE